MSEPLDVAAIRARGAAIRAAESLEDYARVLVADAADVQPENLSAGNLTGLGNLLSEYLALLARVEALEGAIRWALGEQGEFTIPAEPFGRYWWRAELRRRAALGGDHA